MQPKSADVALLLTLQNVYEAFVTVDLGARLVEASGPDAVALLLSLHVLLDVPLPGRGRDDDRPAMPGTLLPGDVAVCCPPDIEVSLA
jgi:hypothetical protein